MTHAAALLLPAPDAALLGLHKALDALLEYGRMGRQGKALRGILADWYEERGSPVHLAIRWQLKRGKRPQYGGPEYIWYNEASACWSYPHPDEGGYRRSRMDPVSDLSNTLWRLLAQTPYVADPERQKHHPTRRLAEEGLWLAWLVWKKVSC